LSWQRPVDPVGSVASTQQQRGALAIGSGYVYVPLGGLYGDCGAYHGYVVGISLDGATALAYEVPTPRGAGIWAAQGVSVASDGSVYAVTGNATSSPSTFGYSDSVLQLSPDLQAVRSYFAPSNWAQLNAGDVDLGSTGVALLANGLAFVIGKDGVGYVLRSGALGGVGGSLASRHVCSGAWGGTSWTGSVVYVPCIDGLYALSVSSSSVTVLWRALHPSLGSPIISAGAVWAIEPASGTLFALDASSGAVRFSTPLGAAEHFSTPAATDGFVVVPAGRNVVALSVVS
jgi:polyvinyl alcohol dehydrogenase (cytochrome)